MACSYCRKETEGMLCEACHQISWLGDLGRKALESAREYADSVHVKETIKETESTLESKKVLDKRGYADSFWIGYSKFVSTKVLEDRYQENLKPKFVEVKPKTRTFWQIG